MTEIKDCCSCIYETRSTFTEPCVSCGVDFRNYTAKPEPKRKRKTNADRIRAMDDENLAIEMTAKGGCPHDCEEPENMDTDCVKCWLGWLKEEEET